MGHSLGQAAKGAGIAAITAAALAGFQVMAQKNSSSMNAGAQKGNQSKDSVNKGRDSVKGSSSNRNGPTVFGGKLEYIPYGSNEYTPFVNSSNNPTNTYFILKSYTSIDWSMTFRGNVTNIGQNMQQIGNGMAYAGYALTLTGGGAAFGVPLAAWGNGISTSGSILESAGNQNWNNVGKSLTSLGVDAGGRVLINRIPYQNAATRTILREGYSFKVNMVENHIIKK